MTAFHTDVLALAQHASTSSNPDLRAAAQRILTGDHALIAEPARTEWAVALTYNDGETRYRDMDDEQEARQEVATSNVEAIVNDPGSSYPGPWMAPANQPTEGK